MKHRSLLIRIALVATLALVAAACQQEGDGGPEPVDDPRGVIEIAADDPIKIGVLQAISGDNASLGTDQVRAIEIAVADKGQLLGHDIEVQVEDDLCDSSGGTAAGQ